MEQLPLRDIHLPDPVSWWPPAPGWWALSVGIPLLIAALAWLILRRVTPIMLALRELDFLESDQRMSAEAKLRRLSILLRRTALTLYSREHVAGLIGEDWLRWLDQAFGEPRFSRGPGRLLVDAPYRPAQPGPLKELLALSREWLLALAKTKAARRALASPSPAKTKRTA